MSFRTDQIGNFEKIFILDGIRDNFRLDGRKQLEYRDLLFETNVLDTCAGSAHVRSGNTDVIVGIKLEIEEVCEENPWTGKGRVQVYGDISGLASPEFEGKEGDDTNNELQEMFSKILNRTLDLEKLVVVPEKSYFVLYVDFTIYEMGTIASLIDVTFVAIKAALVDTRIPKLDVVSQEHNEFTINDNEYDFLRFDTSGVPLFISFMLFEDIIFLDPTVEEEACGGVVFSFAFRHPNEIFAIKKFGAVKLERYEPTEQMETLYNHVEIYGTKLWNQFEDKIRARPSNSMASITFACT